MLNNLIMVRRQPFASFGTSSLQHEPARFGTHAFPKAMRFRAAAVVRLKSSLCHYYKLLINLGSETGKTSNAFPCLSNNIWRTRIFRGAGDGAQIAVPQN
jgi:hypothetical protein